MLYQLPEGYEVVSPEEQRRRAAALKAKFAPVKAPKPKPVTTVRPTVPPLSYVELFALATPAVPYKTFVNDIVTELKDTWTDRHPPTRRMIVRYVAKAYAVDENEILSDRRMKILVWPRHVAIYLICHFTKLSLTEIGRYMRRDHSSIIHGREQVKRRCESDEQCHMEITAHTFAIERLLDRGEQ